MVLLYAYPQQTQIHLNFTSVYIDKDDTIWHTTTPRNQTLNKESLPWIDDVGGFAICREFV